MAYTTIDDPEKHFNTKIYTGNLTQRPVVGLNHQPDFLWFKNRDTTNSHNILDSTRGTDEKLEGPDNTNQAASTSTRLDSFDSDGYTVETDPSVNGNGDQMVVWSWKANGGTRTTNSESGNNPAGGYQANTTAGFSIVDYVGTGATGTMAHGLGAIPDMIIFKDRSEAAAWIVYHKNIGNGGGLKLDTNAAKFTESTLFNNTSPTSSVFTVGSANNINKNDNNFIAYCFTSIQGYSRFGKYTGNGNANGTFIYTGFKPSFIMFKATAGTENWGIFDNRRNTQQGNPRDIYLLPSVGNADSSESDSVDFLSNGFKWRIDSGFRNDNGIEFVYMAFAESPFVTSNAAPGNGAF
ncbi:MAG: hypothetical protein CMI76_02735 [Candidatus Pelagibacter sp.]|nr:hypothetical protein [Candidatus Pelagibacter sp.]|tara:strand:- start:1940 stop:2992 length:1053 start_codon:yes stop_codon:yes gene_type:complete